MRATSDEERRRTTEALHAVYEQATGETTALFRQASDRFSEIVRQMREMSGAMQQELENTRGELRRGILELPQETAESAAQMRRVIVEQIDALAELNRIVAKHGAEAPVEQPMRRAEPAAAGAPERRPGPRLEPVNGRGNPPPQARRAGPPPAAPAEGGRGGWFSDLMGRGGREETSGAEDRSGRPAMASLDSLSVDIARMIDHDAAAEAWDRYKRGDRNAFSRRLYTNQGQRAFEDIRKRYRGDREFKGTVDRYIAEFERILDEVAQDPRGEQMSRSYLTSDTGKVYTMLAHAAGRFDS